jgi:hypothetical protein
MITKKKFISALLKPFTILAFAARIVGMDILKGFNEGFNRASISLNIIRVHPNGNVSGK